MRHNINSLINGFLTQKWRMRKSGMGKVKIRDVNVKMGAMVLKYMIYNIYNYQKFISKKHKHKTKNQIDNV